MTAHDLPSHSDNGGADEQPNQSEPQIQYQSPASGSFHLGMASASGEYMMPRSDIEVGHTMAQATYPYPDPYYGSIFAAYGPQTMMHPHLMGIHQTGVPLPSGAVEEPVYVNAKQYHGILRRRQSRAKAESENNLIKCRKPYLHESRHLHALKRARGCGGRFLNAKNDEKQQNEAPRHDNTQPVSSTSSSNLCSGNQQVSSDRTF